MSGTEVPTRPPLATVHLFGCDMVADATVDEVADAVVGVIEQADRGWSCVVTPNVDHLVRYRDHPDEAEIARSAAICLPDGMPIVWASRLLRRPLRSRLTGSDLFSALWPRLATERVSTVVVAADERVADGLVATHPACHPMIPPHFDRDDSAAVEGVVDDLVAAIDRSSAQVVIVGISLTKTHLLAAHLRRRWSSRPDRPPVVLLLGAAAEFHLGLVPRAPAWMQRSGLEWLHRLAGDPRRLARRYLVDDVRFVAIVAREARRA